MGSFVETTVGEMTMSQAKLGPGPRRRVQEAAPCHSRLERPIPRDLVLTVAVWCSGNALVMINAVALHGARLLLGWLIPFGQVNYLTT